MTVLQYTISTVLHMPEAVMSMFLNCSNVKLVAYKQLSFSLSL
jgi:hypothetical protein